ncbi:MAG: oligoendopeptidase F [Candidatus Marinimicrobia bacterium]|nr:oligoendopeptidase F [Candidatus Neomarinimicrobiota bacterium]
MKFDEFPYKRLNINELKSKVDEIIGVFNSNSSFESQDQSLNQMNDLLAEYESYESIAGLNFNRDTTSEKYKAEKDYYDNLSPEFKDLKNQFNRAIMSSKCLPELKSKYGKHYFNIKATEQKTFDSKIINLLKKETELENEYTSIIAGAEIDFKGKTYNLSGLGPFHKSQDRAIRKESFKARYSFFDKNAEQLDDLYDRMVKLRHKIANQLGFENFIELGYYRLGRTDYGPEGVANFRKQIVEYIVPLVQKLNKQKQEILELDHLYYYDGIQYKEGDPKPKENPDKMVDAAKKMYNDLSKETGEFFEMMVDENLLDLVNRDGKMGGGFCTAFPKYERPYIFSNFNGTAHDVTVLTHEAGHAFQCYSSRKQPLVEYLWPTLEACEIHSMSMEFFTWPWMDLFFKEEVERFKYMHIVDSLSFLPYGACVDHFQHWVYENPEATPKKRKNKWLKLEKIYLPDRDYDDLDFPKSGGFWQGQLHIYQMPFYYIDYTLAQTCAFQFWIKSQNNMKTAWEDYYRLCKVGGSMPFTGLIDIAKLKSPFKDGTLKTVSEYVFNWLDSINPKEL